MAATSFVRGDDVKILVPILIVSALLLSGCDAVSDTVQQTLEKRGFGRSRQMYGI